MATLQLLREKNNLELDLAIYQSLTNSFNKEEFLVLDEELKVIFRDLVYGRHRELEENIERKLFTDGAYSLNCSPEIFLKLLDYLNKIKLNKNEFLPLFRRYLFERRSDKELMLKTVHIHREPAFMMRQKTNEEVFLILNLILSNKLKEMAQMDDGTDEMSIIDAIKTWAESGIPEAVHLYAYCLQHGILVEKNLEQAAHYYKLNWDTNKDSYSLNNYAGLMQMGLGVEHNKKRAIDYYWFNWTVNKNEASLHNYACLIKDLEPEKSRHLFKLNWDLNRATNSLDHYAMLLELGIGGPVDKVRAFEIYKMNWEQNNFGQSLYNLAKCYHLGTGTRQNLIRARELYKECEKAKYPIGYFQYATLVYEGIGGPKDRAEARAIFKELWEKYQMKTALRFYIDCLEKGEGGPKDLEEAKRLRE